MTTSPVGIPEVRVKPKDMIKVFEGLLVLPEQIENPAPIVVSPDSGRVQLDGTIISIKGLLVLLEFPVYRPTTVISPGRVGIKFESTVKIFKGLLVFAQLVECPTTI